MTSEQPLPILHCTSCWLFITTVIGTIKLRVRVHSLSRVITLDKDEQFIELRQNINNNINNNDNKKLAYILYVLYHI